MSLNWDYDNMEMMQEDLLGFYRMFLEFSCSRISKIITTAVLTFHLPLWAMQFYHFYKMKDVSLILQYGLGSFPTMFGIGTSIAFLFYGKFLREVLDWLTRLSWSVNACTANTKKKIAKTAFYLTWIIKVNVIFMITGYAGMIVNSGWNEQEEIFYQIVFFKERFPDHAYILMFVFYATFAVLLLNMLTGNSVLLYFSFSLYFQMAMIHERIRKITDNFTNDVSLIDNVTYQTQVFERLRFCVKRYAEIKSFALYNIRKISPMVVVYYLMTIVMIYLYVIAWYLQPNKDYVLLGILYFVSCYACFVMTETGQFAEDEGTRLYETLVSLNWYTFNIKNRKLFLLFIGYESVPLSLSTYEAFPVNRRTLVQLFKVFNFSSSMVVNLGKKNQQL